MGYRYELNGAGSYVLHDGADAAYDIGPMVAVAYSMQFTPVGQPDFDSMVMHRHGAPAAVQQWVRETREQYIAAGMQTHADELCSIEGAFPVEELNQLLDNTNHLEVLLKRMQAQQTQVDVVGETDLGEEEVDSQSGPGAYARDRVRG